MKRATLGGALRTAALVAVAAAGMAALGAGVRAAVRGGQAGAADAVAPSPSASGTNPTPAAAEPAKAEPVKKKTPHSSAPDAGLLSVHARGMAPAEPLPSPVPMEPVPEGVLLVSAHTSGWITPCGCPGSQAGGVGRRAGYGELLRKTFPGLAVHYFDLGGFLGVGGDVQRSTTEAVLQSMNRIGYDGSNVAVEDLGATREQAEFLDRNLKTPRFSANIVYHDNGRLAFPPYRIVEMPLRSTAGIEKKAIRVGLLGLVDDRIPLFAFGPGGRSLVVSSTSEALDRTLPELKAKTDLIVLLAEMDFGRLTSVLQGRQGIDFVVAGRGQEFVTEPRTIGEVPGIAVGNQGKYLAELRLVLREGKPAIVPFVHWLDERFPENPELARYAEETLDTVNDLSKRETARDTTPPPEIAPFVGAPACQSCHEEAFKTWQGSKHAHAMDTLAKLKRDFTVACVTCHVTGYGADVGGFVNPHATSQLVNVQCEVCHGPGQAHLADPAAPYGEVKKELCRGCHSPATDPSFEYEARWKAIAH